MRALVCVAAVAMLSLMASCSSGDSGARSERRTTAAATTDRREVPVPSITTLTRQPRIDPAEWREEWQTTPGNETGDCEGVGDVHEVRSGDFIAGNFISFVDRWDGTIEGSKLYYVPLHPDDSMPTLRVTAWHHDDLLDDALHYEFPAYAWSSAGWPFYVSGTVLPRTGRWRIAAWAGSDFGCWDVTIPAPS